MENGRNSGWALWFFFCTTSFILMGLFLVQAVPYRVQVY